MLDDNDPGRDLFETENPVKPAAMICDCSDEMAMEP